MKRELDTILIAVSATLAALFVRDCWTKAQAHAAEAMSTIPFEALLPPLL